MLCKKPIELSTLKQQLKQNEPVLCVTVGDSMEPLLKDRETQVLVTPLKDELHRLDLPLYQRPNGQFVMHRIIRTDSHHYYTRGDNCCDVEQIDKDWVCGIVMVIYRKGKEICVTSGTYRCYLFLWQLLFPLRWLWLKARRVIRRYDKQ